MGSCPGPRNRTQQADRADAKWHLQGVLTGSTVRGCVPDGASELVKELPIGSPVPQDWPPSSSQHPPIIASACGQDWPESHRSLGTSCPQSTGLCVTLCAPASALELHEAILALH